MKKRFLPVILVLLFALCAFLGACGNGEHNGDDEGEGQTIPEMEGFTLEEAYERGLLTVADLETLSQFPSNDTLDEKVELAIRTSYAKFYDKRNWYTPYPADQIVLFRYLGEYHGLYAVMLVPYGFKPEDLEVEIERDIGGISFIYGQAPPITVWRVIPDGENGEDKIDGEVMGELFELEEAYEKGYLTVAALEQIAHYNNTVTVDPRSVNSKVEAAIKETAAEQIRTQDERPIPDFKTEDVTVYAYYGRYSNCYVVSYHCNIEDYVDNAWGFGFFSYWEEIGGVPFYLSSNYSIKVFVVQE